MTTPADRYIRQLLAAEAQRADREQRRRARDSRVALMVILQMNLRSSKGRRS